MSERWLSELSGQGAEFADGRIVTFGGDVATGFAALKDGAVMCDLSHLGLIAVSGADAASFLHGQFCNDIYALGDIGDANDKVQWNGWCSPKGRLLATFVAWSGSHALFLMLPRALQPAIQKRLQMFVLRAKVTLADASDEWVRFGVAGLGAEALLRDAFGAIPSGVMANTQTADARLIRLSASRFIVLANADTAIRLWNQLDPHATKVGAPLWDWLSINEGIVTILPQTQDAFVPQMANFELIGGVNFKKGCYPGQEIVARTQYRGILKRRVALAHIDVVVTPTPGDKLYSTEFGDQAAGEIANVAPAPGGGFDVLMVAQTSAIQEDKLRYGAVDGAHVKIRALPYEIPSA